MWMLSILGLGCSAEKADIEGEFVEQELLLQFADPLSTAARKRVLREYGFLELGRIDRIGVSHVHTGGEGVAVALRRLRKDDRLRFAEPNYVAHIVGQPNDPYFKDQWNITRVGAVEAWRTTRGEGTIVAVLDTGVEPGGRDGIHGLLEGRDFIYGAEMYDAIGHGTHVAGTVAQNTDNGLGAAGLAPGAQVLPVKVLGDNGSGSVSAIARGVEWATDEGADVITMSLGWWGHSQTMAEAVKYAHRQGVVLVAAAGNEDTASLNHPAALPEVISVGATTPSDRLASFTNWGTQLDLVAPGVDILQETISGRGFILSAWSGTSMATPHVAAVAALVKSAGIQDPVMVREILRESASDLGGAGPDEYFGHGLLDASAAVRLALEYGGEVPAEVPEAPDEEEPSNEQPAEETGPDESAPAISDVEWDTSDGDFWFTWTTNEPATTDLYFDEWGWYTDWSMTLEHHRELNSAPGTRYTIWVSSEDEEGNIAYDGPHEIVVQ
jgi:subtilisin family serine protease